MEVWIDGSTTVVCVVIDGFKPVVQAADGARRVTNNEGEYYALIHALKELVSLGMCDQAIDIMSDSELMVRQINGQYQIRNERLRALHQEATRLLGLFRRVELKHIPRERNEAGVILERGYK